MYANFNNEYVGLENKKSKFKKEKNLFHLTSRLREVEFLRVEHSDLQKFNLGKNLQGFSS